MWEACVGKKIQLTNSWSVIVLVCVPDKPVIRWPTDGSVMWWRSGLNRQSSGFLWFSNPRQDGKRPQHWLSFGSMLESVISFPQLICFVLLWTDPKSVIYLNKSFCSWMTHGGDDVVKSLGICTLLNLAQLFWLGYPSMHSTWRKYSST